LLLYLVFPFLVGFTGFTPLHAPPFFANPFMAPFLPQHGHPPTADTNSDRSSLSPNSPSPSPNDPYLQGAQKSEFRMNPLTGGYFLSPNQYQEMLQYMQNLMIAGQEGNGYQARELKNVGLILICCLLAVLIYCLNLSSKITQNFYLPSFKSVFISKLIGMFTFSLNFKSINARHSSDL
jgi:hypothetical protein